MNKRLISFILSALTGFALLLSSPFGARALMGMPMHGMSGNQCQASCGIQAPIGIPGPNQQHKDEEADPWLAEPYYLSLAVFASVAAAVAIVLRLYRVAWRPPDKLAQMSLLRI